MESEVEGRGQVGASAPRGPAWPSRASRTGQVERPAAHQLLVAALPVRASGVGGGSRLGFIGGVAGRVERQQPPNCWSSPGLPPVRARLSAATPLGLVLSGGVWQVGWSATSPNCWSLALPARCAPPGVGGGSSRLGPIGGVAGRVEQPAARKTAGRSPFPAIARLRVSAAAPLGLVLSVVWQVGWSSQQPPNCWSLALPAHCAPPGVGGGSSRLGPIGGVAGRVEWPAAPQLLVARPSPRCAPVSAAAPLGLVLSVVWQVGWRGQQPTNYWSLPFPPVARLQKPPNCWSLALPARCAPSGVKAASRLGPIGSVAGRVEGQQPPTGGRRPSARCAPPGVGGGSSQLGPIGGVAAAGRAASRCRRRSSRLGPIGWCGRSGGAPAAHQLLVAHPSRLHAPVLARLISLGPIVVWLNVGWSASSPLTAGRSPSSHAARLVSGGGPLGLGFIGGVAGRVSGQQPPTAGRRLPARCTPKCRARSSQLGPIGGVAGRVSASSLKTAGCRLFLPAHLLRCRRRLLLAWSQVQWQVRWSGQQPPNCWSPALPAGCAPPGVGSALLGLVLSWCGQVGWSASSSQLGWSVALPAQGGLRCQRGPSRLSIAVWQVGWSASSPQLLVAALPSRCATSGCRQRSSRLGPRGWCGRSGEAPAAPQLLVAAPSRPRASGWARLLSAWSIVVGRSGGAPAAHQLLVAASSQPLLAPGAGSAPRLGPIGWCGRSGEAASSPTTAGRHPSCSRCTPPGVGGGSSRLVLSGGVVGRVEWPAAH
ncbi:collagen alpha-2(I) chain-like [Macrobrachium rosenbergii]|uniref:collagen alpha-2(I) chain-like n=1 Tax=Macrobrachium rosenbergii TaxID=79674 RepID=UPI0034D66B95